jgi:ABC-type lipoprotein release transport system permease subunit
VWLFRLTDLGYGHATTGTGFGVAFGAGVGVMVLIGMLSCIAPLRRALRIEPTEALRGEG